MATTALTFVTLSASLISVTATYADGGAGGQGVQPNPGGGFLTGLGGAGGSGFTGNAGGSAINCGGGGGGAAGGGAGGAGGGCNPGGTGGASGTAGAPNGGNGGNGNAGGGGGGGGGANGINAATITNTTPLAGGSGGNGGQGTIFGAGGGGGGGGGGAGGYGAIVTGAGASSNTSSITGGTAGNGGDGAGSGLQDRGGNGGDGGVGVQFTTGGVTFTNSGAVTGGNGGLGGFGQSFGGSGAGGAGIVGADLTIINSGTITGGRSGDFSTRANAITFTGGSNTLTFGNTTTGLTGDISVTGQLTFAQSLNDVTIANTITGPGNVIINSSGRTVNFSGAGFYSGTTTVTAGTLSIASTGSINGSDVTNNATFNNDGAVAGAVTNTGTFANTANGTVGGLFSNTAGTATNSGTLNGGAAVSGGTLTTTGTIANGVTNTATVNANGGAVNGAIANNAGGTFNVGGTVTSDSTFTNAASATLAIGAAGNYTLQGLLTNSGAVTVASGGQLTATVAGITNSTGGAITMATGATVSGSLTNSATVNANGGAINGAIANNAGGTFNVGGTLTSNSTFTNASGATLAIAAAGNYTLQGLLTNTGAITVASGGQLTATVGGITNNAGGTITVAAGGSVADDLNNAGVVTNSGIYTGNVASNTGTITNAGTWTGTVSNGGTFNNAAGATVSGLLTNTAGTTTNNGALNGGAAFSGGTLTGIGSVTNLTLTGGTFAPGSGTPGTSMSVTGNLVLSSAATYLVQINPTTSSFAAVTGTATLGGATVSANYATGSYVAKRYTILTAGSVSGTFGSAVNTNLPSGFKSTLSYDSTHAYIDLALVFVAPPTTGLNGNQSAIGNTLVNSFNSNGGIPLVFGGLTPAGLTQLSGETGVGSQQTAFTAMDGFVGTMTDPFNAGRGDSAAGSGAIPYAPDDAMAYAKVTQKTAAAVFTKAPPADPFASRWSVWAAGYGGSQRTDGQIVVGSNNTTSNIYGAAVGADYRFSPDTIAGFALAGGGTSFRVNNGGTGRSDLFQAGAFIRHNVGAAYITAAAAYGWQDVTTDRTVTIAGVDQLRARFNTNALTGRLESGYRYVAPWIGGIGLTPYAAGQVTTLFLPSYAEQAISGANTFALAYASRDVTATRSELGLRTDKSYALENAILTLRGRAAWAHNFNPDRAINATFQTLPGASFTVNGAAAARDTALTSASAELRWLNGWSVAGTFEGEFSDRSRSYAGKGLVRYAW